MSNTTGHKIWLQGEMLRCGFAFVYPPSRDEPRLDELRASEKAAGIAKADIWGDGMYADIPADYASRRYGHFAFVNGVVLDAARVKDMVYLNFGENWRTDFTIAITTHDLRAFHKAQLDPLDLKGKTIRVRGWIKRDNGPMIAVTDPSQIEILEAR